MADLHSILFNTQALYSFALGIYAAILAANHKPLSGNFWGSVVVYVGLNITILILGLILAARGFTIASDGRIGIYLLYMAFLIVIMPGLFSMQRGRDDRSATITFGILAMFNAAISLSMADRGLATWILVS